MWKSENCEKFWGKKNASEKIRNISAFGTEIFFFFVFKNKEGKIIVEKEKIFQQDKTSDRICIFEFSTSFSTVCGKLDVCKRKQTSIFAFSRQVRERRLESLRKFVADAVDFIFERAVICHFAFDYINRGKNRGMVASEYFCRVL